MEKKKKFMPAAAEAINYLLNWGNLSPGPSGRARLGSQAVTQRSPWRGPAGLRSLRQWLLNSQCRSTQVSHLCPTHTLVTVNTAPTPIPYPHPVCRSTEWCLGGVGRCGGIKPERKETLKERWKQVKTAHDSAASLKRHRIHWPNLKQCEQENE